MLKEFKEFALKGNVMDLAIGVIIGGAFGAIVKSLVDDLIMPIVGMFGGADFSNFFIALSGQAGATLDAAKEGGAVLAYGSFITAAVNFLIIAFILFLIVKAINSAKKEEEEAAAAPPEPSNEEKLLAEIRDALNK